MPRKSKSEKAKQKKRSKKVTTVTTADVEARIKNIAKSAGRGEQEVLEEMFGDGWLTVMVEESGNAYIDASQLYEKEKKINAKKTASECQRLRDNFAPVASCVKFIRDQILASGIDAIIGDPKDKHQIEAKEKLSMFIENVHQDRYTRGLYTILAIMVDMALTTGVAAAEICYRKADIDFWDYATINEEDKQAEVVKNKKTFKTISYSIIKTQEPDWGELGEIVRLKIAHNVLKRFKLYRDPKTWQEVHWTVDEMAQKDKEAMTTQGLRIPLKSFQKKTPDAIYLHPWQIFWLTLNRKNWSEVGESIIVEVLASALLLEKILKAVGEGIHRAGNKRYFIVCGTDKRPWSGPYIRNMLQQMKEASKKNWSTIPAPYGFDIKDIGGEVFEAHNVVAYFKRIIARGIGVPATVLGVGDVKEEPDFSYAILREQVKMAVKYQLFEPHLWCVYGKKSRTKQGGSTEPMYIPNPRFRLEDLFGFEKRLDMILKPFNVANPFYGQTKLRAEKEYCKLMGWDEVLLPTQKEFLAEMKKAEEEMKKKVEKGEGDDDETKRKEQGKPVPQTKERQEKRLEGMKKKGEGKRGESKKMGETRKSVEETSSLPVPKVESLVEQKTEKIIREVVTPTDEIMSELAKERIELAKKQKELTDLKLRFENEDNKRKQHSLKKKMTGLDTEIEKLKKEISKVEIETKEIIKTHEEKRNTMKRIQNQIDKEEELTNEDSTGGEE